MLLAERAAASSVTALGNLELEGMLALRHLCPYTGALFPTWVAVAFMITTLRHLSESWIARVFFLLMAVAFVGWGISGDIFRILGTSSTWVAKVGDQTIEMPAFQAEYQRALNQESRKLSAGQELSADDRRSIGQQTLDRMISQVALTAELRKLRIVTPDSALIATVQAMPAFQGRDGQFNRTQFETLLRNNGYTEDRFLAQLRADISQRQLISAVSGSAGAPDAEVQPLYTSEFEKRSVDMALFPFANLPDPAEPDQAVLRRWYDNHPDLYATPEFRRIKAIELSPETLAPEITVSDEDLQAYYNEHKAEYVTEPKRSAEVLSAPDEAKSQTLAAQWKGGADWDEMQKAAQAAGGAAIAQDDAAEVQFPDPDLAKAVFAAPADTVSGPVKGALSWFVVKVTKTVPGGETSFDQAKQAIRAKVVAAKAADMMYDRANKIDQILGNGGTLDEMPSDLGLKGIEGTLDAQGDTQAGEPAPIPGPPELRSAIVSAAFQTQQGDPPRLTEVPTPSNGGSAYYALAVENVIPPGEKPYDEVKAQVLTDWRQDQKRHTANERATAMMVAVQDGKSFSEAAQAAGVTPHLSPLITRNASDPAIPQALQRVMFTLKPKEATMVEAPDGFVVAQLAEVQKPDPATDKAGYDQARQAVSRSLSADLASVFIDALRERAEPRINQRNFDNVVQPH